MTDDNRDILRRCIDEIWNGGRLDAVDRLIDPRFLCHDVRNQDEDLHGTTAFCDWVAGIRTAFPDLHVTVEHMFAETDRVMVRLRCHGTHGGRLGTIPASGRQLNWTTTAIVRFADNRIAECWLIADELGVLRQLNAVPMVR